MAKLMADQGSILGIDIGSVSLSVVQLDREGRILRRFYLFHKGNIPQALSIAGKEFDLTRIDAIACTSSSTCLNKKIVS